MLFYAWGGFSHIPLLIFYILTNYLIGLALGATPARWILALGVTANLSLLIIFKYLDFLEDQADAVLAWLGVGPVSHFNLALPLGISFFTFQGISYLIDIFRGDVQPQRNPAQIRNV